MNDDPLEDLYDDETPYDKQQLANVLAEYIKIDPNDGTPNYTPKFFKSDAEARSVAILLYHRAAFELGEIELSPAVEPDLLGEGFEDREVRIYDLEYDFDFINMDSGEYVIPRYSIDEAVSYLS